jgi:4-hydroxyphenylpyruvate dioxygenase
MNDKEWPMTNAMTDVPGGRGPTARLLRGWDHVELWVGNARTTAQFFCSAFGFTISAYAGPETGAIDRASYVLDQGAVRFVVTAGLSARSPITAHVQRHGDGVRDLAWEVDDVDDAFAGAVARGAVAVSEPAEVGDEDGVMRTATVRAYGETVHSFVARDRYRGWFAPGYRTEGLPPLPPGPAVGIDRIDHVVGNVELGSLTRWVNFYESVLGFSELLHYDDEQIRTEYSALMSTVVWNGENILLPLNEPAEGRRKSQIQEYLDTYDGPGVQHLALGTDDIVATVRALRQRGVRFLDTPPSYYDDVTSRLGHIGLPWDTLAELGILIDEDRDGYLLQIFTENITDRPTLFLEIIQRAGAKGFGEGNFKALFEAIEREQAQRGNL